MPRPSRPVPAVLARVRALLDQPAPPGDPVAQIEPEPPGEPVPGVAAVLAAGHADPGRRGVLALAAVGVVAALVAGGLFLRGRPAEVPLAVPAVTGPSSSGGPLLVVDVEGKVRRPGLVRLPEGARVDDALRAAGGLLPGVPVGALNLARRLTDGEQILVGLDPAPGAGGGTGGGSGGGASAGGLVDLNLATVADLDGLPGIGPVLAQRIVDWRTEHGRFASVDQLREVSGIGESKFSTLKAKVRV